MTARLRLQPEAVIGQGMASQRVRDRLVERLREAVARYDEAVLEQVLRELVPEFAPAAQVQEVPAPASTVVQFPLREAKGSR